ncbi:hypothetical protein JCM9533A_05990 [Catenuloplanes niger JCM 9533]
MLPGTGRRPGAPQPRSSAAGTEQWNRTPNVPERCRGVPVPGISTARQGHPGPGRGRSGARRGGGRRRPRAAIGGAPVGFARRKSRMAADPAALNNHKDLQKGII